MIKSTLFISLRNMFFHLFDFNLLKGKNAVFSAFNNTSDANTDGIDVLKHKIYIFGNRKILRKNLANKKIFKKPPDFPTYLPYFFGA